MEVRLIGVWHSYWGSVYVLRDINLEFKDPGIYVLVGPNGAGKTTLLKIISLMVKPTRGRVIVNGRDFWSLSEREREIARREIAYVHDKPIVVRGSAKYNLELGLKLRKTGGVDNALTQQLIKRYMLEEVMEKPASKLSAGQAKAVSIVRALLLKPRLLALDEPFTFLDSARVSLLLEDLVETANDGNIVIVATHYMSKELEARAKMVIELVGGEIVSTRAGSNP